MSLPAILAPVFVQIGLTFVLLLWMGSARVAARHSGEANADEIALGEPAWPGRVRRTANAFHNQLELPLLFYVLVIIAILTRKADLPFVVLSWMFVATRLAHVFIHTTSNHVRRRFLAFIVGAILLVLMFISIAARVLVAGI